MPSNDLLRVVLSAEARAAMSGTNLAYGATQNWHKGKALTSEVSVLREVRY